LRAVKQTAHTGKDGTAPEASGRFFTGQKCFCHKVILYLLTKIKDSLTSRPAEGGCMKSWCASMKMSYVWCAIVLQLSIILIMADTLHAAPDTPAVITVRERVMAQSVEPLGFNASTVSGGTNLFTNNFIWGSGMEPAVMRYLVRVERAGSGWIEWDASLGGVHMWDQVATSFGDGATVRLYRIVDSNNQPLSYSGHSDLNDPTGADHVVFLGETTVPAGGWVSEGSSAGSVNRVHFADTDIGLASNLFFVTVMMA